MTRRIELDVTGMSCMMCARRVEKRLNKIDGVHASVKFSTKVATVDVDGDTSVEDLREAVVRAGYQAEERTAPVDTESAGTAAAGPLRRLYLAVALMLRWVTLRA